MKREWIVTGLLIVVALPAGEQKKEEERVGNAGKVMKEILAAPDSIPQSVLDKADCVVVLPSVVKFAIGLGGELWTRCDDLPWRKGIQRKMGCTNHDGSRRR